MKYLMSIAKFLWLFIAVVFILVGVARILSGELSIGLTYVISGAITFVFIKWLWNRVQQRASGRTSTHTQYLGTTDEELSQIYDDCMAGKIPVISSPPITLKTQETAHYACPVEVRELKTETTAYRGYVGTKIKIGKVPIYLGGSAPNRGSKEVLTPIGPGTFVVTDRRIVLSGTKINYSIKLNQITNVEIFRDAIQIMNEGRYGGRYYIMNDSMKAATIIQALISNSSN